MSTTVCWPIPVYQLSCAKSFRQYTTHVTRIYMYKVMCLVESEVTDLSQHEDMLKPHEHQ